MLTKTPRNAEAIVRRSLQWMIGQRMLDSVNPIATPEGEHKLRLRVELASRGRAMPDLESFVPVGVLR